MYMYIYVGKGALLLHDFSADSSDAHRVCPQLRAPFSPSTRAYHRVQCGAVCCSVLQCIAERCCMPCVAACSALQ